MDAMTHFVIGARPGPVTLACTSSFEVWVDNVWAGCGGSDHPTWRSGVCYILRHAFLLLETSTHLLVRARSAKHQGLVLFVDDAAASVQLAAEPGCMMFTGARQAALLPLPSCNPLFKMRSYTLHHDFVVVQAATTSPYLADQISVQVHGVRWGKTLAPINDLHKRYGHGLLACAGHRETNAGPCRSCCSRHAPVYVVAGMGPARGASVPPYGRGCRTPCHASRGCPRVPRRQWRFLRKPNSDSNRCAGPGLYLCGNHDAHLVVVVVVVGRDGLVMGRGTGSVSGVVVVVFPAAFAKKKRRQLGLFCFGSCHCCWCK